MEVATPGMSNGVSTTDTAVSVDSSAVIQYLTEVLQVTLGALKSELESAGSLLSESRYSETVQRCARFASEPQVALYVQKDIVAAEETNGEIENLSEHLCFAGPLMYSLTDHTHVQNQRCNMFTPSPPEFLLPRPPFHRWLSSNAPPPSTRPFP